MIHEEPEEKPQPTQEEQRIEEAASPVRYNFSTEIQELSDKQKAGLRVSYQNIERYLSVKVI